MKQQEFLSFVTALWPDPSGRTLDIKLELPQRQSQCPSSQQRQQDHLEQLHIMQNSLKITDKQTSRSTQEAGHDHFHEVSIIPNVKVHRRDGEPPLKCLVNSQLKVHCRKIQDRISTDQRPQPFVLCYILNLNPTNLFDATTHQIGDMFTNSFKVMFWLLIKIISHKSSHNRPGFIMLWLGNPQKNLFNLELDETWQVACLINM